KTFAAEVDWERRREATQRGKKARVELRGRLYSQRAAYGYQWRTPELPAGVDPSDPKLRSLRRAACDVDEAQAAVLRRVVADLLEGESLGNIARALTSEGVPT